VPQDRTYSAKDVKTGMLVTISAVLLLVLVAITSDVGRYFRPKKIVWVAFKHVVGLQANSPVNYSGVEVGRVKSVSVVTVDDAFLKRLVPISPHMLFELPIEDDDVLNSLRGIADRGSFDAEARRLVRGRDVVLLEMEVDARTMEVIRVDDYVSVESTLMGDTSVEVSPGSDARAAQDAILLGRSGSMFTRISDSVEEIRYLLRSAGAALSAGGTDFGGIFRKIDIAANNLVSATGDFKQLNADLNQVLSATKDDVIALTKTSKRVSDRVDRILARVEKDVDSITGNVSAAAENTRRILDKVTPHVDPLLAGARSLSDRMDALAAGADRLVGVAGEMIDEGRADVRRTTLNVKDASRNVSELTALLSQKPWLLLRAPRGSDRGEEDIVATARLLLDAASRAQDAAFRISTRETATPAEKAELARTAADLKETADSLRRAAEAIADVLKPLDRKGGGKGFEPARTAAPEYPQLNR